MNRLIVSKGPRLLVFLLVLLVTGWMQARSCQEYLQGMQYLFSSLDELKSYLVLEVVSFMSLVAENPTDRSFEEELLCNYNYMRKLSNLSQVSSIEEIDKAWVQEEDYQRWIKKELKVKRDAPLSELLQILATQASNNLEHPEREKDPSLVLYPYNRLRELLSEPRISSVAEVDRAWLEEIDNEVALAAGIEQGHMRPTPAQKKLIEDEIARLKLEISVVPLAYSLEKGGQTGLINKKLYISLCKDLDLDTRLYILYHELGHIYQEEPEAKKQWALDIKDIDHYLQLGWKTIPSLQKTTVGKHLYKVLDYDDPNAEAKRLLETYNALWVPPHDVQDREQVAHKLEIERLADLYMLRQLYNQSRVDPILTSIWNHGMSDFVFRYKPWVIAYGYTSHPSDIERALYALGFLVAHGVDVPKVLYEWETQGICTPAEEEHSVGREAFLKEKISKSHA
jgi:hypothetical protein